jgi:hypothetical protein
MADINTKNIVAPGIGAGAGIMVSDMVSGWLATTAVGNTLAGWTPVVTSALIGAAGLAFIPRSSEEMKQGSIAFAGAGFGLAIISALRELKIIP